MRRLAAVLLLAGLAPPAPAADWSARWRPFPTTPQVPAPAADPSGAVVPAAGRLYPRDAPRDRAVVPAGSPLPAPVPAPAPIPVPLPTGFTPAPAPAPAAGCATPAGADRKRSCLDRLGAWLCFRPTAGDALPLLNPHPYVGPVTGTFVCSSVGCGPGGCAADAGCGTGLLGKLGLTDRGCKGGKCVPPADDAFPGYRFAATTTPPPPPVYPAPAVRPAGGAARP
jgi:hypothetical protein